MKKISAIIPAYNAEEYITEAIGSILNQTYPVHEIIVVDDGSRDKTKHIIEENFQLQTSNIQTNPNSKTQIKVRYIYQENKGPAAARNRGIKESKGEYIAFLDSDDVWLPKKTEEQMKLLEDSESALIYCDMSHEADNCLVHEAYLKERNYKYYGNGRIYKELLKENFIFTPTVIVRKDILEKVGYFDEDYRICEDYKMWLNIAKGYSVEFLDKPMVIRKRNSSNITKDKYLFITSGIRLFEELMNSNGHDVEINKIIKDEYYKRFFELGYYYWDKGDMALARKNFLKTCKYKSNSLKSLLYIIASFLPNSFVRMLRGF